MGTIFKDMEIKSGFFFQDFIHLFMRHTHTHTHTHRMRERERGRGRDTGRGRSRLHPKNPMRDSIPELQDQALG